MLRVLHTPEETVLETCLIFGSFARAMAFFAVPHEMGIESGGYHFWKDRGTARKKINQLLDELGQPNIT